MICAFVFLLPHAGWSTIYYLSLSGADSNAGTSPAAAWKTITKANLMSYSPGDQLLLQGGATFSGNLYFTNSGSAASPILVGSYGSGRATINAGNSFGLSAYNCAGMVISNLNFIGAGRTTNGSSGISFYNDGGGAAKVLDFIRISQVEVSGFTNRGIVFGAWNSSNAFSNVSVTYADVHDNGGCGIQSYAYQPNLHTNFYFGYCRMWNNPGVTNSASNSGSGIVLADVNTAMIEHCQAWTNGWIGHGACGIWCYDSTRVTIQYCESHHNRTSSTDDGDGFDLDGGVTASVMQYNYSHDNDAAGFALFEYNGAPPHSNNIVRFNISQNDGRKNGYGGLSFWNGGGLMRDCEIYNNTVFISAALSGTPSAVHFSSSVTNLHFRNNLFITTNSLQLISSLVSTHSGVLFQGNDYWSSGSPFAVQWGASSYNSLSAWQSAGQEKFGTTNVGFNLDPRLNNPGGGGTIGNTDLLKTLSAYQQQTYSPLCEAGLNLSSLFGLNPGSVDYYGTAIPNGLGSDIGAQDARLTLTLVTNAMESGHLTATYWRTSPTRTNLVYVAQTSTNLVTWTDNGALPVLTNQLGNGVESVKVSDSGTGSRRFVRLKATLTP